MADSSGSHPATRMAVEVQVSFRYTIINGADPSQRSTEQKAVAKTLTLAGLTFESPEMVVGGFHLSFADATFGRNTLEIVLDLGKKFDVVEVLGEVDFYERRSGPTGSSFLVGVVFTDIPADALAVLRDFLRQSQSATQ